MLKFGYFHQKINGYGEMNDYTVETQPWREYQETIKERRIML